MIRLNESVSINIGPNEQVVGIEVLSACGGKQQKVVVDEGSSRVRILPIHRR